MAGVVAGDQIVADEDVGPQLRRTRAHDLDAVLANVRDLAVVRRADLADDAMSGASLVCCLPTSWLMSEPRPGGRGPRRLV